MRVSIHYFVMISVLAHVAIFAAWTSTTSPHLMIPATEASAPTLHVALQSQHTAAPKHSRWHTPRQRKVRQAHKPIPQQQIARSRQPPEPLPVSHDSTPSFTRTKFVYQAQLRRNEIRNRVLSRIRTDLRQYFVYPLLAQRRGWQGRVVLAFSVAGDGMIRNIRVANGSGYPILDTSAIDALSRVRQLFLASGGWQGKPLDLQLPVIFQLQGG